MQAWSQDSDFQDPDQDSKHGSVTLRKVHLNYS